MLAANPCELRSLDRTIERARERIETRALGSDGGCFCLVLRRRTEALDLAFHLGELRPKCFGRGSRLVDDPLDVPAQALELTFQLLELLDRFLSCIDALGQSFDGCRNFRRQHRCSQGWG